MLRIQGESHVSRDPILLLGNITYVPCHVSLNVHIKVKKKHNITPRIVSLGGLWSNGGLYVDSYFIADPIIVCIPDLGF